MTFSLLARDPTTGALAFSAAVRDGMDANPWVAISPDGAHVYVDTNFAIAIFGRDAGSGGLTLIGTAPLRERDDEITVYKSMGIAMEDLVAAELAYRRALDEGIGRAVTL